MTPLGWWRSLREKLKEVEHLKAVEREELQGFHEDIISGRCYPNIAMLAIDEITENVKRKETERLRGKKS